MKKNIIHIHTDYKFVTSTNYFTGDVFNNKIIIIQRDEPYKQKEGEEVHLYDKSKKDLKSIVNLCTTADLVVLYDLEIIKCNIVLSLPTNIKIAWRFFGHELYGKRKDLFLSEITKTFYKNELSPNYKYVIRRFFSNIYAHIKHGRSRSQIFNKTLNRLNFMLGLSLEEYSFLKNYWPNLPEFILLPRSVFNGTIDKSNLFKLKERDKPIVLLGNSRNTFNNHLDLINIIEKTQNKSSYTFTILFNYGSNGEYANEVKKSVAGKEYFRLIQDFIPKDEFNDFYKKPTVLVINAYRQMGAGNITMAFMNGVKVYLSKNNVYRSWLLNEGFKVFTIEDFENDLTKNNLHFDKHVAEHNLINYQDFSKRRTKEDFQKELHSKLE